MEITDKKTNSYFPEDMIFEVVTRASLETVQRVRLTSHELNWLTNKSRFKSLHCQRTGTVSGYIIQSIVGGYRIHHTFTCWGDSSPTNLPLSLNFLPDKVTIEAASNQGLLYCSARSQSYVCKPTTREWVKIPSPNIKLETRKNAMVVLQSKPLRYKIFRFSAPYKQAVLYFTMLCEIFDSADGVWKTSQKIKLPHSVYLNWEPAIYLNGACHWTTTSERIFAFDMNTQKWKMISLPEEALDEETNNLYRKLVQFEGKLGFLQPKYGKTEIWVLENYSRQIWRKRGMLNMTRVIDIYAQDVALLHDYQEVIWYNYQKHSSNTAQIPTPFSPCDVFSFESDLEPVFLAN